MPQGSRERATDRAGEPVHGPEDDWTTAWQPLRDLVGHDIDPPGAVLGPDRVEAGAIRRLTEVLELDCPLHHDEQAARAHGRPGVTAPYTSVWSYAFAPVWEPGDAVAFPDDGRDALPRSSPMQSETFPSAPPTTHIFATNTSYEFVRPLHVGERVGITGRRLISCTPKETRVGRGAFVRVSRRFLTEAGEEVCRVELEMYLYNPRSEGRGRPMTDPAGERADKLAAVEGTAANPPWSSPFEAEAGRSLQPVDFPLPVYRLVMAAGATRDLAPLHHNDDFARASGAPSMYANALFLLGMWERALRDFIGPAGEILAIRDLRMVRFAAAGSTVRVQGKVVRRRAEPGRLVLEVELRSTVDGVLTVGPGLSVVALPR
ncbi:FAS1-like dehydratase domain-containing protein [Streptomyces sp. CB02414]|uniref:FAS1-like dehydratase domain-containing protein n=1 Tax=Streptomyces sp. CB02414 TaxID=1703922 RepID=UPI0018E9F7D8|nr:MaoC family dehydratase N-terminal domain-containing protein [Streptomyces sp. CB02414]